MTKFSKSTTGIRARCKNKPRAGEIKEDGIRAARHVDLQQDLRISSRILTPIAAGHAELSQSRHIVAPCYVFLKMMQMRRD